MSTTDWKEQELGDILTLNYGWSLPDKKRVPGNTPVYGSNGIVGTHDQALVASPGLIVGRKGSAGNVHYSRKPFCPIDTTFYIAPSDTSLDLEFLYFLLLHIDLKRILGDVGVPGLNREMAYKETVRFPTKQGEQRKIASVLGLVQRALEQQERLIALTTELKKAVLHQLFTQGLPACREASGAGRRGEPQKQTEIGPLPHCWEVVELGSLASKISKGSSPRWQGFEYLSEGVLFVRSQNVGLGRMEFADRVFLSSKFNEQEKRSILKDGDILINLVGASIGRVALGTAEIEGANCNQAVGFVRIQQKRSFRDFIVNYLLSPMGQQQMFFQKKDIARANLSLLDLRTFKVPVPSPAEIDEIAAVFTKIENKLDLYQRKHAALTDLFRTLLHQLMTARIRVHDLDLSFLTPEAVSQ